MKNSKVSFGTHLKHLLKANRQTQLAMAKALSVPNATVSYWVNDKYVPSEAMMRKIADFLKLPVSALVDVTVREDQVEKTEISFGSNLMRLIKLNKLTQADLAEALSVPTSTVSYWVRDMQSPTVKRVKLIADFFKISVSELVEPEMDEPVRATMVVMRHLVATRQEKVRKYAEGQLLEQFKISDHSY